MKKLSPFFLTYFITFVIGIILVFTTEKGDVLLYFNSNHSVSLNYLFIFLSRLVEVPIFIILVFIFLWYNLKASIQIGACGLLSLLVSISLKSTFLHPRPMLCFKESGILESINQIPHNLPEIGYSSFPSGHATAAFALMLSIAIIYKKNWISLITSLLAIGTALSRIYLINHFLEDVIAGSLLGIYIALVVSMITDYFKIRTTGMFRSRT